MFIKYGVFSKILKYIPDSGLFRFPLGVSLCTQWQANHQHCSRTGRVQKNHNILRKNTIFNEHPVTWILIFVKQVYINSVLFRCVNISITGLLSHSPYPLLSIYIIAFRDQVFHGRVLQVPEAGAEGNQRQVHLLSHVPYSPIGNTDRM